MKNDAGDVPYAEALPEWADASARSAAAVVPIVLELVRPRSVLDVGCGVGAWLSVFSALGIDDILGVDGDYVRRADLRIPESNFLAWDLRNELALGRSFDLVVCLEVAEHLPEESASSLVQSLVRAGPVVMFSAAIPNQGGLNHLNEQWPDYWAARFAEHDYLPHDLIRARIWEESAVDVFYRQNILLFAGAGASDMPGDEPPLPLRLVHPETFAVAMRAAAYPKSTKWLVKELPSAVRRSVRYRLRGSI